MNDSSQNTTIKKGSILIHQGRYKEAASIFQDALSQDPEDDEILHLLAVCQYHFPGQAATALTTINQAIALDPQGAYHHELKGMILAEINKYPQAMEVIKEALSLNPYSSHGQAVKAYIYIKLEKWREAEAAAREALALDADNMFAGNILATALNRQNRLDESAHLVSDMLRKDPEDCYSHSNAGWVYLNRKNYRQAQIHFREALRLDPNFEPARLGMLEVLKSKSLFYRLYLQYGLFMSRQTKQARWGIILGIYLVFRIVGKVAQNLFEGPLAFIAYASIILLYGFFFWTWLSGGIGNFIIFNDPFARHALNRNEKLDAILVGGTFLAGIVVCGLAAILKMKAVLMLGGTMVLSTVPFAVTFTNAHKDGRLLYGSAGAFILCSGVVSALFSHWRLPSHPELANALLGSSLLLFIASTWLGAFGVLRKS